MNTGQLRERFPNENACRNFFESIICQNGRFCPHFGFERSIAFQAKAPETVYTSVEGAKGNLR